MLPALRPAAAVLGLLTFMETWNDFLWPYVVLTGDTPTVQISLKSWRRLLQDDYVQVFTGTALAIVPLLLVFIVFGRQIIGGIMEGSVKGGRALAHLVPVGLAHPARRARGRREAGVAGSISGIASSSSGIASEPRDRDPGAQTVAQQEQSDHAPAHGQQLPLRGFDPDVEEREHPGQERDREPDPADPRGAWFGPRDRRPGRATARTATRTAGREASNAARAARDGAPAGSPRRHARAFPDSGERHSEARHEEHLAPTGNLPHARGAALQPDGPAREQPPPASLDQSWLAAAILRAGEGGKYGANCCHPDRCPCVPRRCREGQCADIGAIGGSKTVHGNDGTILTRQLAEGTAAGVWKQIRTHAQSTISGNR